jgi:hypothetical protein
MSDQENFLTRWLRRKLEPADKKVPDPPQAADAPASGVAAAPAPPEFDVSTLPSLDSIAAETDVRAFLQAGVPLALRHAALRRAWSADPTIRDYIGPNENFWEVAGPSGVPGFGDLDPTLDIKKLVAEIFGETEQKPEPVIEQSAPVVSQSAKAEPQQQVTENTNSLLQRDENVASHSGAPREKSTVAKTRRHGGAMPQ